MNATASADIPALSQRPDRQGLIGWGGLALVLILLVLAPQYVPGYWLSAVLTPTLWLGIAASSLTFLQRYGGMTSLGQWRVLPIRATRPPPHDSRRPSPV